MDTVLHCDCGFEARAADEQSLVAEIRRHARDAHGMALSHDEALVLVLRAGLEGTTTAPVTRGQKGHSNKEET